MLKGLYIAYTGMINEQHRMDTLTNNLANASTVGFKKEGATSQSFDDILTVKIKDSYDLALAGEGFFAIEFTNKAGETSTMYGRGGQFTLNTQGYLVTEDGDYVLDTQNRRIRLNTLQDAQIDSNGRITQNGTAVATIQVADFEDYNYLEKYGETYYRPIEGARLTRGNAQIKSGYLEMANVQIVSEMVNLIAITRAYESNQKIIQTYDSSLEIAATQLGRV